MNPKRNKSWYIYAYRSRILTSVFVLVIFGLGWILVGEYAHRLALQKEAKILEASIDETAQKSSELSRLLGLVSSPEYLELEAKAKLNLKREGENVFALNVNTSPKEQERTISQDTQNRSKSWFDFLGW